MPRGKAARLERRRELIRQQSQRERPQIHPTLMTIPRLPDWVVSDTHFGHLNLVAYTERPWDWEERLLTAWRELVRPGQIVLHLGDISFKGTQPPLKGLSGHGYFIRGNHDKERDLEAMRHLGWIQVEPFQTEVGEWKVVFSHWPMEEVPPHTINVHGHTHVLPEESIFHINCSLERQEYRPQPLRELIEHRIAQLATPDRRAHLAEQQAAERAAHVRIPDDERKWRAFRLHELAAGSGRLPLELEAQEKQRWQARLHGLDPLAR